MNYGVGIDFVEQGFRINEAQDSKSWQRKRGQHYTCVEASYTFLGGEEDKSNYLGAVDGTFLFICGVHVPGIFLFEFL